MRCVRRQALTLLVLAAGAACRSTQGASFSSGDSALLARRESQLEAARIRADTGSDTPLTRWLLPPGLAEISGLGLTADQRLLTHNDEVGRIFEVNYRRGVIVKSFSIGDQVVRDDFEGIAVAGDRILLLASTGKLYQFAEGANGAHVPFTVHDTGLGTECEFEGLAYDATANALVLACKNILAAGFKDFVVLYKYRLADTTASRIERMTIPLDRVIGTNAWRGFTPSDITVDPASGDYVLVASQQKALLRVTPAGDVVWSRPLPPGQLMTEGLALTRDSLLILSDEASSAAARADLTLYRWP
jgi:uncharacterized protein YjiK